MAILNLQFLIKKMDYTTPTLNKILSPTVSNSPKLKQAKSCKYMKNQISFKDEILKKKFKIQNKCN
jgi:hypothetical protein